METKKKTELDQYMDADGLVRAEASYDRDHAFHGVWQDGENEHMDVVRSALGADFVEPTDTQEVNRISAQLRHLAEISLEEARAATDDAAALALFRRSTEMREAGEALHISTDSEIFLSQIYGDDEVDFVREIVRAWDAVNGGQSWSAEGPRTSAEEAWDRELSGSRSGYSEVTLEATEDWIRLSFSGYGCDMGDVRLQTRRGEAVEAMTSVYTEIDLDTVDRLAALGPEVVLRTIDLADLTWGVYDFLGDDGEDFVQAAEILTNVQSEADFQRVREAVKVLDESWSGDFSELVRAAVVLTLSA